MLTPFRAMPSGIKSLDFLARARQFRHVAADLVDMHGPEPNWPKWFLTTHAIELAIKAFIVSREDHIALGPEIRKPANHDLVGLYEYAVALGLKSNQLVVAGLPHLSDLHRTHYARYPTAEVKPVHLIAYYDDMVDALFEDVRRATSPLGQS
jgi:hypothetical protein